MRKIFAVTLLIALVLMICGCSGKPAETTSSTAPETTMASTPVPQAIEQKPMAAVSLPVTTDLVKHENGTVLFHYAYQNLSMVLPEPEVADKIIVNYLSRLDTAHTASDSIKQLAESAYSGEGSWLPYFYNLNYKPTRIDQSVLSLYGVSIDFSGSAHPNRHCLSANYDLTNGEVLTLGSIINHIDSHEKLELLVVEELEKQANEAYLYDDYKSIVAQRFEKDESFDEDWYFSDTGLCFYFSPYEIAPYSSGVIVAEIPYSKLSGILSDSFFPPEKETVSGVVSSEPLENADLTKYNQIAELILDKGGKQLLFSSQLGVSNVQITAANALTGEICNVFATQYLTPGDGIMVEASEETLKTLTITYDSQGQTLSMNP